MSAEQKARDLLARMGVEGAQSMSAGEFVELANLIEAAEGAPLPNSYSFALLWPAAMPDDVAKWLTANLPVKVCVNPPRSAVRHVAVPRYDFPPGG